MTDMTDPSQKTKILKQCIKNIFNKFNIFSVPAPHTPDSPSPGHGGLSPYLSSPYYPLNPSNRHPYSLSRQGLPG